MNDYYPIILLTISTLLFALSLWHIRETYRGPRTTTRKLRSLLPRDIESISSDEEACKFISKMHKDAASYRAINNPNFESLIKCGLSRSQMESWLRQQILLDIAEPGLYYAGFDYVIADLISGTDGPVVTFRWFERCAPLGAYWDGCPGRMS